MLVEVDFIDYPMAGLPGKAGIKDKGAPKFEGALSAGWQQYDECAARDFDVRFKLTTLGVTTQNHLGLLLGRPNNVHQE